MLMAVFIIKNKTMEKLKVIGTIVIGTAVCIAAAYFLMVFIHADINHKEPINTIFLSKSKAVTPTMRRVLSFENIRVYQYSDSLGTYTIFASEYDFIGVK